MLFRSQATQTLYNTQEKPVKSAILKGQTLVNLSGKVITPWTGMTGFSVIQQDNYAMITVNEPDGWFQPAIRNSGLIKTSTQYLMVINVLENTLNTNVYPVGNIAFGKFSSNNNCYIPSKKTGVFKFVLTSKDSFTTTDEQNFDVFMQFGINEAIGNNIKLNVMIIEYQDGMENWDIPYFEGMTSVKVPVLRATGKNLFDGELEIGFIDVEGKNSNSSTMKRSKNFIPIKPNTDYIFSTNLGEVDINFICYDEDKQYIKRQYAKKITTPHNCRYLRFYNSKGNYELNDYQIQIEEGSTPSSYESYKSNILTTSEEVELRGIDDIRDELDLITGELSQKIDEVVVNGSENIRLQAEFENVNRYFLSLERPNVSWLSKQLSNRLLFNGIDFLGDYEHFYLDGDGNMMLFVGNRTITEVQQRLNQNNLIIQYQLETESVKTVDLSVIDQDGNVLPKIKTFNNITHVNVSSDGILPKVEMEVATYNEEDIANANVMTASMDEIYSVQNELDNTNSIQSEEIDSTMIASTEIYENIL